MRHTIWLLSVGAVLGCGAAAYAADCGGCSPCGGDKVLFQFKSFKRHACGTLCCSPCAAPCAPAPVCVKACCPQDCGPRCKLSLFADRPRCQKNPCCVEPCPKPCANPCAPTCGSKFSLKGLFHKRGCGDCGGCGSGNMIYTAPAESINKMPVPK